MDLLPSYIFQAHIISFWFNHLQNYNAFQYDHSIQSIIHSLYLELKCLPNERALSDHEEENHFLHSILLLFYLSLQYKAILHLPKELFILNLCDNVELEGMFMILYPIFLLIYLLSLKPLIFHRSLKKSLAAKLYLLQI